MVRKFQYGGISGEDIKNGANLIGEYFLKALGAFGKLVTSPFVQQGPTSATIYKSKDQLAKERTIQNKSEQQLGNAMTWISPLNYGVALATGNGLNARKGEEKITQWAPAWQALGRAAELYAGPKAIKGWARTAKNAVVARQTGKATQKPLAMQRSPESPLKKFIEEQKKRQATGWSTVDASPPKQKMPIDNLTQEPQTIQYILDHSKEASDPFVQDIVDSYNKLENFLNSAPYRQRLKDYYKKRGSMVITQERKPAYDAAMQIDNISQATFSPVPLIQVEGFNPFETLGAYIPDSHGIEVRWAAMDTTTPRHEMIHARNKGYPYMDNDKYAMRTKAEMDLQNFKDKNVTVPSDLQQKLDKNIKYYGNVVEQEPRILNTLIDMQDKGIDINNLNQKVVNKYFDRPINELPQDTQSLLDNYEYNDILKALQNFKGTLPLIGYTSYKYFNNGKDK